MLLSLCRGFISGREGCLSSEWVYNKLRMLVNDWAWLKSRVSLVMLKVHLGSGLEPELRQKWKYGALKASKLTVNVQATLLHLFHTIMCSLHVRQGTGI